MTSGPVPAGHPGRVRGVSARRRAAGAVADSLPVVLLAVIAGAGSFTHIRDTAAEHGQRGPMASAVAVCVDLTCVMAARERQRDKRHGVTSRRVSWPTIVLAAGVLLSLAANLAQAQPTAWGRVVAAVPAGAFLVAVSMLERRATLQHRHHDHPPPAAAPSPGQAPATASGAVPCTVQPVLAGDGVPDGRDRAGDGGDGVPEPLPGMSGPGRLPVLVPDAVPPLVQAARQAAAEHYEEHGQPVTRDALRTRLGVSNQAASALLRQIRQDGEGT